MHVNITRAPEPMDKAMNINLCVIQKNSLGPHYVGKDPPNNMTTLSTPARRV